LESYKIVTIHFKRKKVIFDSLLESNYHSYLKSEEWRVRREKLVFESAGQCGLCFKYIGGKGVVHHISYDDLFKETGKNEIYICRSCHEDRHGG